MYTKVYKDQTGMFRKDKPDTLASGRITCDAVKVACSNTGFFISDELSHYDINRKNKRQIIEDCDIKKNDLIALCAYSEAEAGRTFEVLDGLVLGQKNYINK